MKELAINKLELLLKDLKDMQDLEKKQEGNILILNCLRLE